MQPTAPEPASEMSRIVRVPDVSVGPQHIPSNMANPVCAPKTRRFVTGRYVARDNDGTVETSVAPAKSTC